MKTILVDAWNTFVTENGINQELKNLLDSFSHRKIILTNATDEECIKFGIVNMPYEVFSLQHNPNKTDPEYFSKMLAHFNLKTEDVIYFEHNPEAVQSAVSIGIISHIYDENLKVLSNFINLNL